jgi:hypothetical protein
MTTPVVFTALVKGSVVAFTELLRVKMLPAQAATAVSTAKPVRRGWLLMDNSFMQ